MNVAEFDKWREDYDAMSYAQQLAFYNQIALDHPLQRGFDAAAFKAFFEAVPLPELRVLEFGGWKGELAAEMLPLYPSITQWINLEISKEAVIDAQCHEERYRAIIPHRFAWEVEQLPAANVFVSSHAIEHIRAVELKQLFGRLKALYIGLQAPLTAEPTDWSGYYGSHILEIGWTQIGLILAGLGFAQFMEQGEFRGFRREA